MRIPLPGMMRHWREREFERHLQPSAARYGLGLWAWVAKRPSLYRFGTRIAMHVMGYYARKTGKYHAMPFASGWTDWRDLPAPQGKTFQSEWKKRRGSK